MQKTDQKASEPLYRQLTKRIRADILDGVFATGSLPAERQLSKRFGASVVTVRRALKILAADGLIRRHQGRGTFIEGWHARPPARNRSSDLLAYISGAGSENIPGNFFNTLMLASQRAAEALGYSTVLSTAVASELPAPVRARRVDGIILAGTFLDPRHARTVTGTIDEENANYLRALAKSRLPVVSISNHGEWPAVHRVLPDYDDAFERALDLFMDHGHRRIALWGGPFAWPAFRARLEAFRRAALARGLPVNGESVIGIDGFSYLDRHRHGCELTAWLRTHRDCTALLMVSGPAALAVHSARAAARSIPGDLSVMALTDFPPPRDARFAYEDPDEEVPPHLTAFVMPIDRLAEAAVERAVHLAQGRPVAASDRTRSLPFIYYPGNSLGYAGPASVRRGSSDKRIGIIQC